MQRISYPRVHVEVSADKPPGDFVDLDFENEQPIEVEVEYWLRHTQCLNCRVFGQSKEQCS